MSRVIKSNWANTSLDEQKIISIRMLKTVSSEEEDSVLFQNDHVHNHILIHAQEQAEEIIKDASARAQAFREQISQEKAAWEQEKAALIEEARNEGFSKGLIEGREQGQKEYHEAIVFAQKVVESSKNEFERQVASSEKTILQIGIKAAEKILGKKLSENEEAYLSIVKRALKEAREYRDIQLHVNPCHYEFLLARKEELSAVLSKEIDIFIYPDDELSEKACLIESLNGRIDASVDSQLEEIKRKLLELLEGASQ